MAIKINQTTYELVPTGEYPAVIDDVEYSDGKFGQQLRFRFALQGQYQGRILSGWTSPTFSPNSKLYGWVRSALGGGPIPKGQEFNSDEIIGKQVILVVVQKVGENGPYSRIEDVRPFKAMSV